MYSSSTLLLCLQSRDRKVPNHTGVGPDGCEPRGDLPISQSGTPGPCMSTRRLGSQSSQTRPDARTHPARSCTRDLEKRSLQAGTCLSVIIRKRGRYGGREYYRSVSIFTVPVFASNQLAASRSQAFSLESENQRSFSRLLTL